ncbi:MAG TPA: HAD hydrolase family protein, partial [Nitrospiria bacterium]
RITRGGRLFHLTGENDKGKAVQVLTGVFQKFHENVVTIGIGDSLNDLPMLEAVDHPVLVQKPGGGYQEGIRLPGLERARGVGPEGWSQAVLKLIGRPSRR